MRTEYANEGVYYKLNRAIIKVGNKYLLRDTYTGEEHVIPKFLAVDLKRQWNDSNG